MGLVGADFCLVVFFRTGIYLNFPGFPTVLPSKVPSGQPIWRQTRKFDLLGKQAFLSLKT